MHTNTLTLSRATQVQAEHLAMVELLLAEGAALRVDEPDRGQWTALHYAAKQGALDAIRLLLAHGADRRALDQRGRRPLDVAQEFEQLDVAYFLHSLDDSSKPMTFTVSRPPWSSVLDHKWCIAPRAPIDWPGDPDCSWTGDKERNTVDDMPLHRQFFAPHMDKTGDPRYNVKKLTEQEEHELEEAVRRKKKKARRDAARQHAKKARQAAKAQAAATRTLAVSEGAIVDCGDL
jgi:hypothetical protein